jgi:prephenate dehydratase
VKGLDDLEGLALDVVYKNHIGLMAIENSLVGSLMDNYRILNKYDIHVFGEVYLRIEQNLLGLPGSKVSELKEVHSHPMALAQCAEFFHRYPQIHLVETEDTAKSAANIANKGDREIAAIASSLASEIYKLPVLAKSIETHKQNYTRFLVISNQPPTKPSRKASLSFTLKHEPGSLHRFLKTALNHDLNLTKIQSTPVIGEPWRYRFFVDLVSKTDLSQEKLISTLSEDVESLSILGIYEPGEHFTA